ncbi:MAG: hypothetical protein WCJ75_01090 [Desulfomonile sp.]|jgi:hypothetical protein
MILFFNQVQKVAERYLGFIFLDEDYKGSKHKDLWQCKYKHKFRMSWDQIDMFKNNPICPGRATHGEPMVLPWKEYQMFR